MKILVINAGSSSLKYQLIDLDHSSVIAKGICERIGIPGSMISYKSAKGDKYEKQQDMKNHEDAIAMVLEVLADPEIGVIKNMSEIDAVGHRVLHGGEKLYDPILIDDEVLKAIEDCIPLGPLHNPANLMGIRGCMAVMPGVPMVAVFDTGWGMAMEKSHYMYALPYEAYENYTQMAKELAQGIKDNVEDIAAAFKKMAIINPDRKKKVIEVRQEAEPVPVQEVAVSEATAFGIKTADSAERQRLYEGLLARTQEEQKKRKSKKPVVDENQLSLFGFVA